MWPEKYLNLLPEVSFLIILLISICSCQFFNIQGNVLIIQKLYKNIKLRTYVKGSDILKNEQKVEILISPFFLAVYHCQHCQLKFIATVFFWEWKRRQRMMIHHIVSDSFITLVWHFFSFVQSFSIDEADTMILT